MADSVTTPYGPGVVVESQTVRGRTEYRVEGNDFAVWLTAAQIPEFGFMIWDETPSHEWDNSTVLPYNPTPQFPAWSNGESTVQPTHHLDPNKRTSPADSVHFSSRHDAALDWQGEEQLWANESGAITVEQDGWRAEVLYGPGTAAAANIYKPGGTFFGGGPMEDYFAAKAWVERVLPKAIEDAQEAQRARDRFLNGSVEAGVDDNAYEDFHYESPVTDEEFPGGTNVPEDHSVPGDFALGSHRTGLYNRWEPDGPGAWLKDYADENYTIGVIEEGPGDYSWRIEEDDSGELIADGFAVDLEDAISAADAAYQSKHGSVADLQARLGPKYVDIPVGMDRTSLQARLDADPVRVVGDVKAANAEKITDLDPRIGQALDLELSDPELRSSAWSDVRAKASRLRRSGNVQVEAANPTAIVAVVTGDHGIYDVAVLRGSALTGSSAVTEWTCSCFPAGTPVTMADGTRKAIESVQAGDMVLTAEGNVKRVARTMNKRYVGTLYGFTTASFTGERVWSTNDHPWFVLPEARCSDCARNFYFARCDHVDRASGDFMEARDVREGMYLKLPRMISPDKDVEIDLTAFMESHREVEDGLVQAIKTTEGRFFGREGSVTRRTGRPLPHRVLVDESLAYAFGLFIGDGHFHNDDEFGFTFGGHEMMVAERLRDILTEKFGINVTIRGPKANDNTILVRAYNTIVQKVFRHFCGFGSHDKVIHESLMQAGDEVASGLTEGWKDSDGCVSVNRNLISQFRNLFTRLGVVTKVYRSKAASQHNDLAGHNGKDIWAIGYKFGNVKKSSKNFMEEDGQYSQINSIESQAFDGTVYNLEVEDDHTYVVGEYAVHNCPWGEWAFERQHTYVGRLCSHAYASLLELRAMQMRRNKSPNWSGTAGRKEVGVKTADIHDVLQRMGWEYDYNFADETYSYSYVDEDGDHLSITEYASAEVVWKITRGGSVIAEGHTRDFEAAAEELYAAMGMSFSGSLKGADRLETQPWRLSPDLNQIPYTRAKTQVDVTADEGRAVAAAEHEAFMDEPYLTGPDSFSSSGDYVSEHEGPYADLNGPEFNPVVRNGAHEAAMAGDDYEAITAAATANGWDVDDTNDPMFGNVQRTAIRLGGEVIIGITWNTPPGLIGSLKEAYLSKQDPLGWAGGGALAEPTTDVGTVIDWIESKGKTAAVTDSADEHHAKLGYLIEEGSGGNDDIAGAAAAFLKTAGRQFTLAEQQELMDEEGLGGPIEASDLDLRNTHYL